MRLGDKKILVFLVPILALALPISAQERALLGVRFEIVSVRVLNENAAAKRSPDFFGPNIAVRLRLSTTEPGVFFYSWKGAATPAGYKVERSGQKMVWLFGKAGTEKRLSSPGLKDVLSGLVGEWVPLPVKSTIEWEELDSTLFSGSRHAFSIFVRTTKVEEREVFSDFYDVPSTL